MLELYKKRLHRKPPPVMYPEGPNGRQVCSPNAAGKREYERLREVMELRQNFTCPICKLLFLRMEFDHEAGRGANGKHRDDRIYHKDGSWRNAALCSTCNTKKASKRYRWQNGKYLPLVKAEAA